MSDNIKALGKRKSFNKSKETISNAKMLSKSPTSKVLDKTPIQTKPVPKILSAQKENLKKSNKKRKSLPANLINGADDISAKKTKLEPFTGTTDLFMQMKNTETDNIKTNKEDKSSEILKADSTSDKSETADDTTKSSTRQLKKGKRREDVRARRAVAKDKFKKTIADAVSGDTTAITLVKTKIAELAGKQKLTNSGKRKLRLLKKVLKDDKGIDIKQSSSKVVKQESNATKQKGIKKGKNETNKKAEINKMDIEKDDDSDDVGEEVLKKEIVTKTLKNKKSPLTKVPVKPEETSDNDDEEELDDEEDESETEDKSLIEEESMEDEEEEDGDEDEEEDGDEDEEEDGDEEEEEDDSDEEEKSNSNDKEIEKTQKPKKKQQTETFQKEEAAEMNSPSGTKTPFTLFVGNIPYDVTQEEIAEHFSKAGSIKEVRIPVDKKTNKSRGFAYVQLLNLASYQKALALHHSSLNGRRINVMDSESKGGQNSRPYQTQRGGRPFGNNRGSPRGFSRGSPRGFSRGSPRGFSRGSSRGSPRGSFQRQNSNRGYRND